MTVSPSDTFTTSPVAAGPLAPPLGRAAAAAVQRRQAALARLAARRMPLPGAPAMPSAMPPAPHAATVRRPIEDTRPRPHMHLVAAPEVSTRPSAAPTVGPHPTATSAPGGPRRRPGLTDREIQVLRTWLLTDSKIAVAKELSISIGTVNTHLTRIRAKYSAVDRTARTKAALAARAIQDGIMSLDEL